MTKLMVVIDEPTKCRECPCYNNEEEICRVEGIETKGRYRPVWCPAIKMPKIVFQLFRWITK